MQLTKKQAVVVKSAINAWLAEQVVSKTKAQALLDSIQVIGFEWQRLAKYSFWI